MRIAFAALTLFVLTLALASAAVQPAAGGYLIRNVRVFDGVDLQPGTRNVLIVGNTIRAVSNAPLTPPAGIATTSICMKRTAIGAGI